MINQRLTLTILDGLPDEAAVGALTRELEGVPGVTRAYVNPSTEMAYIQADTTLTDPGLLVRAGFHAGPPSRR